MEGVRMKIWSKLTYGWTVATARCKLALSVLVFQDPAVRR